MYIYIPIAAVKDETVFSVFEILTSERYDYCHINWHRSRDLRRPGNSLEKLLATVEPYTASGKLYGMRELWHSTRALHHPS